MSLIDRLGTTRLPAIVRIVTGAVLVFASNGKFLDDANHVEAFRDFEVPWPEVAVPLVGAVELIGGVLLVLGFLTRPAAIANAGAMIGAIATAGRVEGGPVHLVLAPLLLLCLLFVIWAGPGRLSIDEWRASGRARRSGDPATEAVTGGGAASG